MPYLQPYLVPERKFVGHTFLCDKNTIPSPRGERARMRGTKQPNSYLALTSILSPGEEEVESWSIPLGRDSCII
jgi:hypothetical protein